MFQKDTPASIAIPLSGTDMSADTEYFSLIV